MASKRDVLEAREEGFQRGIEYGRNQLAEDNPGLSTAPGLDKVELWRGRHLGIGFEIRAWQDLAAKWIWTYYVSLSRAQLPDSLWHTGKSWEHPLSSGIVWHGGCTYVDTHGDRLTLGCDYNHAFEQNVAYSLDRVYADAKETIEDMLRKHPDILVNHFMEGMCTQERYAQIEKEAAEARARANATQVGE